MSTEVRVPGGTCHVGNLRVTEEAWVSGTVDGGVIVEPGGVVAVTGVVTLGVLVEARGAAYITGMVGELCVRPCGDAILDGTAAGDVQNWGRALIAGTVVGHLVTHPGAETQIVSGARVHPILGNTSLNPND